MSMRFRTVSVAFGASAFDRFVNGVRPVVSLVARALPVSSPSARCREARDAEISSHVLMSSEVDFVRVAVGVV